MVERGALYSMPYITRLAIQTFRNLGSVDIEPGASFNIFIGENGSGKTSLLESISVLAHGRSFRTHKYRRLIQYEALQLTLFARLQETERKEELQRTIGVMRDSKGGSLIKVDGSNAQSAAELAQALPLLIMNASSFLLLEGAPKVRRQFFDWLVFHVEHEFRNAWKHYARCVKQRNSLLRHAKITGPELDPWDREVARYGAVIERCRQSVFAKYQLAAANSFGLFDFVADLERTGHGLRFNYVDGWKLNNGEAPDAEQYYKVLQASRERDLKLGYTSIGSHKSDLQLHTGKIPAVESLSRGQQKSVITALFLAQAQLFNELSARHPVFLLDDLPSELDARNLAVVEKALSAMASQVFITAISEQALQTEWGGLSQQEFKMFHVEHGSIKDVPQLRSE